MDSDTGMKPRTIHSCFHTLLTSLHLFITSLSTINGIEDTTESPLSYNNTPVIVYRREYQKGRRYDYPRSVR